MAGGTLAVALACAGFGFVAGPWLLGLLALVLGAGFGALMLGRLNYVTRQCPAAYRGRAITALAGIQRVGLLVGPAAGGLIAEAFGFGAAFAAAAVLNVAGLVLIGVFVRRSRRSARGGAQPHRAIIARILRDHRREFTSGGHRLPRDAVRALRPPGPHPPLGRGDRARRREHRARLRALLRPRRGDVLSGRLADGLPRAQMDPRALARPPRGEPRPDAVRHRLLDLPRGRPPLRARERLRHRDHHGPRRGPLAAHEPGGSSSGCGASSGTRATRPAPSSSARRRASSPLARPWGWPARSASREPPSPRGWCRKPSAGRRRVHHLRPPRRPPDRHETAPRPSPADCASPEATDRSAPRRPRGRCSQGRDPFADALDLRGISERLDVFQHVVFVDSQGLPDLSTSLQDVRDLALGDGD